jgi:hypothetical protein
VGDTLVVAGRPGDGNASEAANTPRLTLRCFHQPGANPLRVLDAIKVIDQHGEYVLEDVGALLLVKTGPARDAVDQPLVAGDERLPGCGIPATASLH